MASDAKKTGRPDYSDSLEQPTQNRSTAKNSNTILNWLGMPKTSRTTVAIIGTAGRGDKAAKMSKELFEAMVVSATSVIESVWKIPWDQITLVSGAAAWSDHVAVSLFLQKRELGTKLELYLPCPLDVTCDPIKFEDTGVKDFRVNPGATVNRYHGNFSKALEYDTIKELKTAEALGAVLDTNHFGFHARNSQVAKSSYVLAFTWSSVEPEDGGTKHTWSLCHGMKHHIDLSTIDTKKGQHK